MNEEDQDKGTGPDRDKFDVGKYLTSTGTGRRFVKNKRDDQFFAQGNLADAVYFLHSGRIKLSAVSHTGREAAVTILNMQHFFGEEAISPVMGTRQLTATAMMPCTALRIEREEMLRVLHQERSFSDMFIRSVLAFGLQTRASLIDQLFNPVEKRLARQLLLMADFKPGQTVCQLPQITQETLAQMVGTVRPRISIFMKHFKELGFIDYSKTDSQIKVYKSLYNVLPQEQRRKSDPDGD